MTLLYVYDALCGWCYGFSPAIQTFVKEHVNEFSIEVISGGMVTGDRIGPIGDIAPYISSSFKTVEDKTGVKFGHKFLNDILAEGSTILTSVPSAIAMAVFKSFKPEYQLAYAAALQKAIYFDGIKPENTDHFCDIAEQFGVKSGEMKLKIKEQEFKEKAQQDFELSGRLGVSGFPTTFLYADDKLMAFSRGAVSLEVLEENYQNALKEIKDKAEN